MLRNDTARVIQPEIIYRADTIGQPNSNTIGNGATNNVIDRKGSVAGQSVFYTDYPPQDYGNSGISKFVCYGFCSIVFFCCLLFLSRLFGLFILSMQMQSKTVSQYFNLNFLLFC